MVRIKLVIFMNKRGLIILGILIAILLIGGIGYYLYNNSQTNKNNSEYESKRTSTDTQENRKCFK